MLAESIVQTILTANRKRGVKTQFFMSAENTLQTIFHVSRKHGSDNS